MNMQKRYFGAKARKADSHMDVLHEGFGKEERDR
jgi:hypothetical protein